MIEEETFKKMLTNFPDDMDFVLKVIQADVIASKTTPKDEHLDPNSGESYLDFLVKSSHHNNITIEHYNFAVELYEYQCFKMLGGLGGSNPAFPKRSNHETQIQGSQGTQADSPI